MGGLKLGRPIASIPCGLDGERSILSYGPNSELPLWESHARLSRRTVEDFPLSLLRLSETDRFAAQRCRLLSAGQCGAEDGPDDSLSPSVRQRIRRDVSLLSGVRLESVVGSRSPAGPRRGGGRVIRRPRLPDARAGRLGRKEASLVAASGGHALPYPKSGSARYERIAGDRPTTGPAAPPVITPGPARTLLPSAVRNGAAR